MTIRVAVDTVQGTLGIEPGWLVDRFEPAGAMLLIENIG